MEKVYWERCARRSGRWGNPPRSPIPSSFFARKIFSSLATVLCSPQSECLRKAYVATGQLFSQRKITGLMKAFPVHINTHTSLKTTRSITVNTIVNYCNIR